MTTLRAISLSSTVAGVVLGPSFSSWVHSVSETHVCLVSSHLYAISIEWDDLGKSSNGVTVIRPDDVMTFLTLGVAKGTECRRNGNVLTFVGCDCSVLLENVEPWNPKLLEFAEKDKYEFYKANVEFLLNCLSIKFKNDAMESVGLGPIGLLVNSGDQEYLEKAVQQEWRLRMLTHLYSMITHYRRAEIRQAISAVVKIFELGEITHTFLIGICASLWAFGAQGTSFLQEGIKQIIQKTRKQVFISEAEVILAFQGNFSEKLHRMVRAVIGGEDVHALVNSDNLSIGCILGICVGVKLMCSNDDNWIAGITTYLSKEKTHSNINNTSEDGIENNADSFFPRFFKQTSWRRMLNL